MIYGCTLLCGRHQVPHRNSFVVLFRMIPASSSYNITDKYSETEAGKMHLNRSHLVDVNLSQFFREQPMGHRTQFTGQTGQWYARQIWRKFVVNWSHINRPNGRPIDRSPFKGSSPFPCWIPSQSWVVRTVCEQNVSWPVNANCQRTTARIRVVQLTQWPCGHPALQTLALYMTRYRILFLGQYSEQKISEL